MERASVRLHVRSTGVCVLQAGVLTVEAYNGTVVAKNAVANLTVAAALATVLLQGCSGISQSPNSGTLPLSSIHHATRVAATGQVKNNVRPLDPTGGVIRAITDGGFQGTFAYAANNGQPKVNLTLSNSGQTNAFGAPVAPGATPVLYLAVGVSGTQTVEFSPAALQATISSSDLLPGVQYTMYLYQGGSLLSSVNVGSAGRVQHMLKFASPLQNLSIAPGTPLVLEFAPPPGGNIFVTDQNGDGNISELVASDGYSNPVHLLPQYAYNPLGLTLDGSGNLFFSDNESSSVFEVTQASNYTAITRIGAQHTFYQPVGLAVDSAENLFVADNGANTVDEVLAASGYETLLPVGSGYSGPIAVALDGSGNAYVSDNSAGKADEAYAAGGYTTVQTLASGFTSLHQIAVDRFGNVFLAVQGDNKIVELVAANGYAAQTLGSGFYGPSGVAVDPYGNVFVTDEGNSAIKEIVAAGGYSTILTLSQSVAYPFFIAIQNAAVSSPRAHARTRKQFTASAP